MTENKHTPGPWMCEEEGELEGVSYAIRTDKPYPFNTEWIADTFLLGRDSSIGKHNAEFIVRACNSHYEMLEALEAILKEYETDFESMNDMAESEYSSKRFEFESVESVVKARQAIAKAKGD